MWGKLIPQRIADVCWVALVALLPVTSLPAIRDLIGSDTTVAGPSAIVLAVLILVWGIPFIFQNGKVNAATIPLLGFVGIAVLSTALAQFIEIPAYKDNSVVRNNLEALLTLMMAFSFFFFVSAFIAKRKYFERTARIINWSGAVMLGWALVQALAWYTGNRYPDWLRDIHGIFSVGPLYRQRATGFALEPSWFAHQLNMLYLPLWLAISFKGYSFHRKIFKVVSFENILLVAGIGALGLTLSRVGFIAFLLMITFLLIRITGRINGWMQKRVAFKRVSGWIQRVTRLSPRIISILSLMMLYAAYFLAVLLAAFVISKVDMRMANLFKFDFSRPDAFMYYANQLTFASRVVFWQAGWNIFNDFPWLGVGLGNAGYFIPENISAYGWKLVEVRDLAYRSTSLFNIKSLWVRLLAETGIIGFSFITAWVYMLWKKLGVLREGVVPQISSLFGVFVLLGLLVEGFSIDSFALPYIWFSTGLFCGGCDYNLLEQRKYKEA